MCFFKIGGKYMAKSGLNVDTGQLNEYGDYLITSKDNIEELLNNLDSKIY